MSDIGTTKRQCTSKVRANPKGKPKERCRRNSAPGEIKCNLHQKISKTLVRGKWQT